jgi:hypothetical protein
MEIKQNGFQVFFDHNLDDVLVQFEIQSKGYLYGTILKINNEKEYQINFYDSSRFKKFNESTGCISKAF